MHEGFNQLILPSQYYFPISEVACRKSSMNIYKLNGVWVSKMRRLNTEDRERLSPIVVDTRLLEKIFEYLHTSHENRSIYIRRLHHPLESVVRQNVKCEVGVATPQFQQLARKHIENCMVCSIN